MSPKQRRINAGWDPCPFPHPKPSKLSVVPLQNILKDRYPQECPIFSARVHILTEEHIRYQSRLRSLGKRANFPKIPETDIFSTRKALEIVAKKLGEKSLGKGGIEALFYAKIPLFGVTQTQKGSRL